MTTGKDRSGKYHPPKGKPSGSPKKANEKLTLDDIKEEADVKEEALENTRVRHVNRDATQKPEEKSNKPDGKGNNR